MKEAGEAGLVWSASTLDSYLEKPRDFIKHNRMSYRGMEYAADRADLIAYLEIATAATPAADPARQEGDASGPAGSFTDIVLKLEGDPEYGEYLSGECVTCHQVSGAVEGIPSIVGIPKAYFIRSLFEYKTNVRSNEVMKLRVQNLTNEEIAALAAYFEGLQPQ